MLPAQLGPWQQVQWEQADARGLESLAGPEAALLREYGSQRAEWGVYRRGNSEWRVTAHQMVDHSGAYGAFTLFGRPGQPLAVGEDGARTPHGVAFYQSNYLVLTEGEPDAADLAALAERLRAGAATQTSLPNLLHYLPRRGLVAGSDRYVLGPLALERIAPLAAGDWAGFAYGAEVEAARYRLRGAEATLLIISYPTPQIARARLRELGQIFNLNGSGEPSRTSAFAKRLGSLVIFASGVDSAGATGLLEQVRVQTRISWSDPSEFQQEDPNWGKTLLNIFIGTALFLLFALGSGIAYGLLRLGIKRMAPGKIFDRPEDSDVITLNLRDNRP